MLITNGYHDVQVNRIIVLDCIFGTIALQEGSTIIIHLYLFDILEYPKYGKGLEEVHIRFSKFELQFLVMDGKKIGNK